MNIRSCFAPFCAALIAIGLLAGCDTSPAGPATDQSGAADQIAGPAPTTSIATGPTPEPPLTGSGPWPVTFTTADQVVLSGTLYGDGTTAVVLAPTYPGGRQGWAAFAGVAAAKGFRLLSFDFRGYGDSKGNRSAADQPADLDAAMQYVRNHSAQRIVLIGAGSGGSAAIKAAGKSQEVVGLVVISAPRTIESLQIANSDLTLLKMPSLWLAARNDMAQNVEEMYGLAGSSKKDLWIYEGSSLHGTYIFEGADGSDLQRRLLEFIAGLPAA
jgi:pimeloyl-ACP methyl ester carboxylesterase